MNWIAKRVSRICCGFAADACSTRVASAVAPTCAIAVLLPFRCACAGVASGKPPPRSRRATPNIWEETSSKALRPAQPKRWNRTTPRHCARLQIFFECFLNARPQRNAAVPSGPSILNRPLQHFPRNICATDNQHGTIAATIARFQQCCSARRSRRLRNHVFIH